MSAYQSRGNVKSAARALSLLEFFDAERRPATVTELCEALDVPQSSMSMLLKSMVSLGYIEQVPGTRTYTLGYRAAFVGDWARSSLGAQMPLRDAVRDIAEDLGETVVLATQNGPYLQYVYVASKRPVRELSARIGIKRPMVCTAAGRALLSRLTEPQIRQIARRNNAEATENQRMPEATVIERIGEERNQGFAESLGGYVPGIHSLSILLQGAGGARPLALGVGGPAEVMGRLRDAALSRLSSLQIALQ